MLWGYAKKLLIADKMGIVVSEIFTNYAEYPGIYVFVAAFGYGIQIYADFSGYMDIMCGFCQILGIELAENFRQPYFAHSIENFWQRWHITLGAWFKDYVFSPIAMGKIAQKIGHFSRKKLGPRVGKYVPGYFALIFVWTLTGLWHGAAWAYIIWGWMNLLIIVFSMQFQPVYDKIKRALHIRNENVFWKAFQVVRTFVLVCFFRFFSYGKSVRKALAVIMNIPFNNYGLIKTPTLLFPSIKTSEICVVGIGILVMLCVDLYKENKWEWHIPMPIRTIGYTVILVALILWTGGDNDLIGGFVYAQF